jgi:hypothetical protein
MFIGAVEAGRTGFWGLLFDIPSPLRILRQLNASLASFSSRRKGYKLRLTFEYHKKRQPQAVEITTTAQIETKSTYPLESET